MRLFKTAESHTTQQHNWIEQIREKQQQLHDPLQRDMARSLQSYDQRIGQLDEGFTNALKNVDQRLEQLQTQWTEAQQRIEQLMRRSESLLDQFRPHLVPDTIRKQPATSVGGKPSQPSPHSAAPCVNNASEVPASNSIGPPSRPG